MRFVVRSLVFSLSLSATVLLHSAENNAVPATVAAAGETTTAKHALANTVWEYAKAKSIYTFYPDGTFYEEFEKPQRGTWTVVDGDTIKVVPDGTSFVFTFTVSPDGATVTRKNDHIDPAVWNRLDRKINGTTAPKVEKLPNLPWHMVNLWWNFEKETADFQSFSIDFSINQTVDSSKLNLYIAPIGYGKFNEVGFYGGIQTNSGGWPAAKIDEKWRHDIGKGAIFSRWGKGAMSLDNARAAIDGVYESAGYEGDFVSVRRPFPWTAGKYTYSLFRQ
ncbi:MAG: hypothetical protein LBV12_03830, partial [Puniceicoccales bacterium]|nr:hypothetical protein [Puniceicoccales bacterium]